MIHQFRTDSQKVFIVTYPSPSKPCSATKPQTTRAACSHPCAHLTINTLIDMLRNTAAVHALQDGCRRLHLANNTATELLHFLSTKRTHDQFVDSSKKQLNMSPGATVDKLWHYMLLNTAGTAVEHTVTAEAIDMLQSGPVQSALMMHLPQWRPTATS
jgi:hypothetical protein